MFLALFLTALVSALTISVATSPGILTTSNNDTTFTITSTENINIAHPATAIIVDGSDQVVLSITPQGSLNNITSATFNVEATSISPDFEFGQYKTNITIEAINSVNVSDTDSIEVILTYEKQFYEGENKADLKLTLEEPDVASSGFGEDDEWYLFDEIELEFEIDNRGSWDVDDIQIEACLYSLDENECVLDEDDMNLDQEFKLKDGDDKTITASFVLDPDDFKEGNNDYRLYIKAVGEIDDNDAGVFDETESGTSDYEDVKIIFDDHFVIIGNINIQETVSCSETIELTAEVWNIGDDDEDEITVLIRNSELGINEEIEIGDLDVLDDKKFTFQFAIPEDAEEKSYTLIFEVYDEENDIYENDEDDESRAFKSFTIEGSCIIPSSVEIEPTLESDAIAGEEMEIKISLTNTGRAQTNYQLVLANYHSWAELGTITPESIILEADETGEIIVTLIPNRRIEGENEFTVKILYNENTNEQSIVVPVQPRQGFSITGSVIGENLKENWLIWVIALVNIILIILIIIVAIRIARR